MQESAADTINVDAWRESIRRDTFANYHYEMGIALEKAGSLDESEFAYRRVISILPSHGLAYWRLIALLESRDRSDLAETVKSEALRQCPDYEDRWLEEQALSSADEFLDGQKFDQVFSVFQRLSRLSPRSAFHCAELAKRYRQLGITERALASLTLAERADPELPEVRRERGLLAWSRQQPDEAVAALDPILSMMPHDQELAGCLAWCRLIRTEFVEALQVTAPHCKEPTADVLLNVSHSMALHVLGRYEEALSFLSAFYESLEKVDGWGLLCSIGLSLQAEGLKDEAVERYQEALSVLLEKGNGADEGHVAMVRSYLGLGLQGIGDLNGALSQHRKAVECAAPTCWNLSNLALCLDEQGEHKEAMQLITRSWSCPDALYIPLHLYSRPWARETLQSMYTRTTAASA